MHPGLRKDPDPFYAGDDSGSNPQQIRLLFAFSWQVCRVIRLRII